MIDDLFGSLGLDKAEWLEDIERGESSLASYLACIDECTSERECKEGLDNKVKLAMHKKFALITSVLVHPLQSCLMQWLVPALSPVGHLANGFLFSRVNRR